MVNEKVIIGRFGAAFGVRGWLKVISFTDPEINILEYQPWFIQRKTGWESIGWVDSKIQSKGIIVKLANCDDRDAASTYTNYDIAVDRTALPKLANNEFYWSDLVGLEVVNQEGIKLGVVERLLETGANDVLVVAGDRERLIPYIKSVIIEVNLAKKQIQVDWDSSF